MRRAAALPEDLIRFAEQGGIALFNVKWAIWPLELAYDAYLVRCTRSVGPVPQLNVEMAFCEALDDRVRQIAREFAEADRGYLILGSIVMLQFLQGDRTPLVTDYDPFATFKIDPAQARQAGWEPCAGPEVRGIGVVITGPDGKTYYVGDPGVDESGWTTMAVVQAPILQKVGLGIRVAAALSGVPDPIGAPQSADWYASHFRVDSQGKPIVSDKPVNAVVANVGDDKLDDGSELIQKKPEKKTKGPKNTARATTRASGGVAIAELVVVGLAAAQQAGNYSTGYYAVRFQTNSQGHRRAVVTLYQQRGKTTLQANVHKPEDLPPAKKKQVGQQQTNSIP